MTKCIMGIVAMWFLASCYLLFLAIGALAALATRWVWGKGGGSGDLWLGCAGSVMGGIAAGNLTAIARVGPGAAIVMCLLGALLLLLPGKLLGRSRPADTALSALKPTESAAS